MNDYATTRAAEARRLTTAAGLLAGLACLAALVPAIEQTVNLVVLGTLGLTLAALALRVILRRVQQRREDRADAMTAARWRAAHAPHLLDDTDRARLTETGHPAAVPVPAGQGVS